MTVRFYSSLAILLLAVPSYAAVGFEPFLKKIAPSLKPDLLTALKSHYKSELGHRRDRLSHNTVTLVHPDGRYVFSTVVDEGGGMMVRDHVVYWSGGGKLLVDFLFDADADPEGDEERVMLAQVAAETVVRTFYVQQGFKPLSKKHDVPDLASVFLSDRARGFYLKLKWKGVQYNVRLHKQIKGSDDETCESGKVTGVVAVEDGVVVSFQPPTTYLDAEAGPAQICSIGNGAASARFPKKGAPIVRYQGRELTMKMN